MPAHSKKIKQMIDNLNEETFNFEVNEPLQEEEVVDESNVESIPLVEDKKSISKKKNTKIDKAIKDLSAFSDLLTPKNQKKYNAIVNNLNTIIPVNKPKQKNTNGGFQVMHEVSDAVRRFLKLQPGEKANWETLTKEVNKYIRENKLQHPQFKTQIVVDKVLDEMFRYNELKHLINNTPLTYQHMFKFFPGICFPNIPNKTFQINN
jgi:hypothetical protein